MIHLPQTRRSFLGIGLSSSLAMAGLSRAGEAGSRGAAKNVLVILEQGGLSHVDTWDPKPDANVDHRSPHLPIPTVVPGMQFTDLLPNTARVADKLAVIRSMHHDVRTANGHPNGTQYALSGRPPGGVLEWPDIGSIIAHRIGSDCDWLPPYVMVPGNSEQAKTTRLGFMPPGCGVYKTGGKDLSDPDWRVPNLGLTGIEPGRFHDRRELLSNLDIGIAHGIHPDTDAWRATLEQGCRSLLEPRTKAAFRIQDEPDAVRDRYGRGHRGQCYLLGRRLIERGVRFVTVDVREPLTERTPGGSNLNWDHHDFIYTSGSCNLPGAGGGGRGRYGIGTWWMMGSTDLAFSALIEDMDRSGLLEETLVCFVTEFGRTPRINKYQGRDHWVDGYSIAMAGAGVPGGQVVGATDREGGQAIDRPYTPNDYAATIYAKLGIDLAKPVYTRNDRPVFIVDDAEPIREVM